MRKRRNSIPFDWAWLPGLVLLAIEALVYLVFTVLIVAATFMVLWIGVRELWRLM